MTDKRIKSYLEDRLKRLESIRNEREWTTAELGDIACCKQILAFINSLQEEPVSEDLEEACEQLSENARKHKAETSSPFFSQTDYKQGVIDGAKWKEEQFEKNRLAACDRQTEEEAEMERDFCMGIIEKEHRQPTFDDAIKYGMRLHKEQMMANTADATIGLPYENKDGGYTHLVDVSRPLPVGNNKIAIIFKEDSV